MRANTAKDRIMTHLNDNPGASYTNRDLADILVLPAASVRRTINELRIEGQVMLDMYAGHRNPSWMVA
jgi:hypothetical protein